VQRKRDKDGKRDNAADKAAAIHPVPEKTRLEMVIAMEMGIPKDHHRSHLFQTAHI